MTKTQETNWGRQGVTLSGMPSFALIPVLQTPSGPFVRAQGRKPGTSIHVFQVSSLPTLCPYSQEQEQENDDSEQVDHWWSDEVELAKLLP